MGANNTMRPHARKSRIYILLIVVVIAILLAAGVVSYKYALFQTGGGTVGGPGLMTATCSSLGNSTSSVEGAASGGSGSHAYFLIVEADPGSPYEGMNGSAYQTISTHWPVMHVRLGQTVSFHVINCATSESHGFQIENYDQKTIITVQPGQSYNVTFTADQKGTFKVYCDVFCLIHPLMQNGELIVS